MEGDFGPWVVPHPDPYGTIGDHCSYVGASDVQFDMPHHPLGTDPLDISDFLRPMYPDSGSLHVVPYGIPSDPLNGLLYNPMGKTSTSQRYSAGQGLHIDTRVIANQTYDSGSSTASSSAFSQPLSTPCHQFSSFQSPDHVSTPQSASPGGRQFMPMTPPSMSPSLLSLGRETFDNSTPSLPIEPEVETQSPMAHILEWKRVIELCGTNDFVPQAVYQPYTEADKKRYIKDVTLQETIVFHSHGSCEWGIYLDDALKQKLRGLKDKDNYMFIGCGPSVSIRIQWPGYPAWSKQIPTMDFKTPKRPITRAKLAKNIAACVRRFLVSMQNRPMEADSDRNWKIGSRHIKVEDLVLVSLHHVSKGSWQPQLRFRPRLPHPLPLHRNEFPPPAAVS